MMRLCVCVVFVCSAWSHCVFAAAASSVPAPVAAVMPVQGGEVVSFDFSGVPVMQFAQSIYREALGRDFVVSSDLVDSNKKVSVKVKALPVARLASFVDDVLRSQGVSSVVRDGVYYLDRAVDASNPGGDRQAVDVAAPSPLKTVVPGSVEPALPGQPGEGRDTDLILLLRAENRPADFVVSVLNGVFGPGTAKLASGSAFVVSVQPKREKSVRDVLAGIDAVPRVVEVVASFVEVTRTKNESRGLSLVSAAVSRKLGVTFDTLAGQATLQAGSYQLVLDALAGDGRFKQVSNSRLVGDDGEKLSLLVGDETPTVSSSTKDNQGNPVQNITYRPSGVILDVQPKVTGSGRLALTVDGQVSSFQTTVNGVSGSPTLVKRQVKTAVSLDDGQVLVIGGLDDSKATGSEGGFSFLPSTWRASSSSDQKTDLVLILSARVLPGPHG